MTDDIILEKKESVERCIKQIDSYYDIPRDLPFERDYLIQDAIAINLQRACELCIDLANHTIKRRKLGLPSDSRDSFVLLARAEIIPNDLSTRLTNMVGFRNVLVHQYAKVDLGLMVEVVEEHLGDLIQFTNLIVDEFRDSL